jgi:hypothetical protein
LPSGSRAPASMKPEGSRIPRSDNALSHMPSPVRKTGRQRASRASSSSVQGPRRSEHSR